MKLIDQSLSLVALLAVSSAACKKPDATATADASPAAAASEATVVVEADSAAPSEVGANWYPAGTNQEVKLSWAVYPKISESEAGERRNIEVVARIGTAVRRVMLGPHDGYLTPSKQSVCNPALKTGKTVAVLGLTTMGPRTFTADRVQPGLLEIVRHVMADPEEHKVLARIPIPADARITDALVDIRSAGNEGPFDCAAANPAASSGGEAGKAVTVTGKFKAKQGSYMPGGKDPSGRENMSFDLQLSDVKLSPAVGNVTDLVFEPLALPLSAAPGNAKLTAPATTCNAHLTVEKNRPTLDLTFWDSKGAKDPSGATPRRRGDPCVMPSPNGFTKGFNATARGKLKDGSPATVTFVLTAE